MTNKPPRNPQTVLVENPNYDPNKEEPKYIREPRNPFAPSHKVQDAITEGGKSTLLDRK